jgi:DNA polymerase III subunit delta'
MMNFFTEIIGQDRAVQLLLQAIAADRIAPAYLFAGPDGVGRSLAARSFIEQLFCAKVPANREQEKKRISAGNHPDLLWVEPTYLHNGERLSAAEAAQKGLKRKAPPSIRLEQVREITQFLSRPPLVAPRSLVVLEQAESMAEAAANALLKTLEEPGRATIILIAPSVESLLPTLVSRCQRIPFYRLTTEAMTQVLREKGHGEILEHEEIVAIAQGSPGEAIASMEQLQSVPSELIQELKKPPKKLRDALELARKIDKTLDTEAQLWLIDYLQHCYWQQFLDRAIIDKLEKARKCLQKFAQPRLVWEVTLMEMSQAAAL